MKKVLSCMGTSEEGQEFKAGSYQITCFFPFLRFVRDRKRLADMKFVKCACVKYSCEWSNHKLISVNYLTPELCEWSNQYARSV